MLRRAFKRRYEQLLACQSEAASIIAHAGAPIASDGKFERASKCVRHHGSQIFFGLLHGTQMRAELSHTIELAQ